MLRCELQQHALYVRARERLLPPRVRETIKLFRLLLRTHRSALHCRKSAGITPEHLRAVLAEGWVAQVRRAACAA